MNVRRRFLSGWNGVATIVFFGGIFLGVSPFGISGVMLGIFMWIVGGAVAGILFGPETTRSKRKSRTRGESQQIPVEFSGSDKTQFCIACGSEFSYDDQFCPECGTVSPRNEKNTEEMMKKTQ